jgi:hypothetical protein
MTTTAPRDDDARELPRDAWLREALRHAPDADAAPPAALREAILREARAATARPGSAPRPAASLAGWRLRLANLWSWLAGPRVAAGFASVMVATVVGLMWWGRPIDDTLHPAAPSPAPTPSTGSAATPTPTPAPSPSPATATAQPEAQAMRSSKQPAPPAAAAPPPRRQPQAERQEADASRDTRAEAQRDIAAKAAPPPSTDAALSRERSRQALPDGAAPEAGQLGARALAASEAPRAAPASWSLLLRALRDEPQQWRWQRDGSTDQPANAALQAWMQQLDRAAAARWTARTEPEPAAASPVAELHLLRDGAWHATLRFYADGRLQVEPAGAPPFIAQLPAADAAALQRGPDGAAAAAPR